MTSRSTPTNCEFVGGPADRHQALDFGVSLDPQFSAEPIRPCALAKFGLIVRAAALSAKAPSRLPCQLGSKTLICSLAVPKEPVVAHCLRSVGEVPERSNGAVSKTVVPLAGDRGFESLPLRHSPVSGCLDISHNPA
jgi:hypothetical protein